MLNRQACFEHAVSTIARQKAWSARTQKDSFDVTVVRCQYRGDNGCRCAVGALIDDANYSLRMESNSAHCDIVLNAISHRFGAPGQDDDGFLDCLQRDVHDSICYIQHPVGGMEMAPFSHEALVAAARSFAARRDLDSTFLDSLQLSAAA